MNGLGESMIIVAKVVICIDGHEAHPHLPGYAKLACFVNSDDAFKNFRKFGELHCRVLLYHQQEIADLEEELFSMDYEDSQNYPRALKSQRADEQRGSECRRKDLIQKIGEKLSHYGIPYSPPNTLTALISNTDDLMHMMKVSVSLRAPSSRNRKMFARWIQTEQPSVVQEQGYYNRVDDLVNLSQEEESRWLDGAVEDMLSRLLPTRVMQVKPLSIIRLQRRLTKLKKIFMSEEQGLELDDDYVHLRCKYRIDALVRLILTLVIVALLLSPSAILFSVRGHGTAKLFVILGFTLLFAACVSGFTKAKR